ncbi:MAG: S41 family peptidase [Tepidisphaeraceae bacterium]|jgi:carboxyl-terminal processing protease
MPNLIKVESMKLMLSRVFFGIGCVVCLTLGLSCRPSPSAAVAAAGDPSQPASLSDDQPTTAPSLTTPYGLETAAVQAAENGDFGRSEQLLGRAQEISHDPESRQMEGWVADFESQRQVFDKQRHEQFQKAAENARILLAHKMDSYAIDEVSQAYLLADSKAAFRGEKWVDDLVKESAAAADADENGAMWLNAWRMYQDLSVIEPGNPVWKNKIKVAALRVRLLLEYAPLRMKKLQETEWRERDAADALIHPSTQPSVAMGASGRTGAALSLGSSTTRPAVANQGATTQPAVDVEADDESPPTDWHDMIKGIQFDMLYNALELAAQEYYRDVTLQNLLQGGLNGLETVVTTDGLEDAFPGLKDPDQRKILVNDIEEWKAKADVAGADDAGRVVVEALTDLREVNAKTIKLPEEVFVSEFADGAFSKLDLFTTVIWPYDAPELEKTTEGQFGGVGIQIESDDYKNIVVVQPLPDTPASRAGVRPGDVIAKINGKTAKGLTPDGAVKIITGVPGTTVTLTMRSLNGSVKDYVLKREFIKVASVKGFTPKPNGDWNYMLDSDQRIGYVRLTGFSKSTGDDLGRALEELKSQQARAIILDLRDNPGGLLDTAKKVVNEFIDHGVIVSTHADRPTSNPPSEMDADAHDLQTTAPLVVLVNQYSASASEIVSGALKDWHRGLIVGQRTFGKGSVQMLFPLDSKRDAYLKLTTSHYYLPSGRCIHREENSTTWGVDPDVTIDMTPGQMIEKNLARLRLDVLDDWGLKGEGNGTTRPSVQDMLKVDPQLSAALLILRLQLAASQETAGNQAAMR